MKKKIKRSRITTQRGGREEEKREQIGLKLKNSGRIHIKNYFPNEPG